MADLIGSATMLTIFALGALLWRTNILERASVARGVEAVTKKRQMLKLNLRAVEAGFQFAIEQTLAVAAT